MPSQRILREILYFLTFHFPASVEQLQLATVTMPSLEISAFFCQRR